MNHPTPKAIPYHIPPTPLIPNSTFPLLHYPSFFSTQDLSAAKTSTLFSQNGWQTQWIIRYAPTQQSHYHSKTHETMVVLNGSARIRFGAADGDESPGREFETAAGDVWVIPAGVAHKTFETRPERPFAILTPGDGHGIGEDVDLAEIDLDGFVMMGAYPQGSAEWDFCCGGEGKVDVERPRRDPVVGDDREGLLGLWA